LPWALTVLSKDSSTRRGDERDGTLPARGNNQPARYFLSTRLTKRMLVNNIKRTITEPNATR
jgi:hypothetical protein